jgi:adenine phosphoribosyltransferase
MAAETDGMDIKKQIRVVPDFPREGIFFYDITTLLKNGPAFEDVLGRLAAPFVDRGIQKVVAIESRGFIFGAPLAARLGAGFIPVRKPGKLPAECIEEKYSLEYGTGVLALHRDAIVSGERVLIVDDLIATGGTAQATVNLVRRLGGDILGMAVFIELSFLNGRALLGEIPLFPLLTYDS